MSRAVASRVTVAQVLAVLVGGAVGGVLRWSAGELAPDGSGFPTTTLVINVVGSALLALLPALRVVRRHALLVVGLGPGVLGGFTTLSTATEQTRALLDSGRAPLALAHAAGTLAACLVAVAVVTSLTRGARPAQDRT